jgi:hypothetical protein
LNGIIEMRMSYDVEEFELMMAGKNERSYWAEFMGFV